MYSTKPKVVHIEDEPDWIEIIRTLIEQETDLEYQPFSGSIKDAIRFLRTVDYPVIAIFDLRLVEQFSEFDSIEQLSSNIDRLINNDVEILILSGYLPKVALPILREAGIPQEHVFFKEGDFGSDLNKAVLDAQEKQQRILHFKSQVAKDLSNDSPVCDVSLDFSDFKGSEDYLIAQSKSENLIRIRIEPQEFGEVFQHRLLHFSVYCLDCSVTPESLIVAIPGLQQTSRILQFHLTPDPTKDKRFRTIFITIYYNNHLLRKFEIPLRIDI